jgi:hypothetical protein
LANAVLLPPGSAVVELIQRFWTWKKLDRSFKDQTDVLGDVHHFAWRALHLNQTVYLNPRDLEKCASERFYNLVIPRVATGGLRMATPCSNSKAVAFHSPNAEELSPGIYRRNVFMYVFMNLLKRLLDPFEAC